MFAVAAVPKDLQDQEGFGQEGQAKQTYSTVDQIQDRQQNQVSLWFSYLSNRALGVSWLCHAFTVIRNLRTKLEWSVGITPREGTGEGQSWVCRHSAVILLCGFL